MFNQHNNNNNTTTQNDGNTQTVTKIVKDDIFGEKEIVVEVKKTEAKTVSAIQRAKERLAELQERQKKELEAIKKLQKAEALKADKQIAALVRELHSNNFNDYNTFKNKIKEILD